MELKNKGYIRYTRLEEGGLLSYRETKVSDLDLEGTEQGVSFQHADACNLKGVYSGYDLVLATNLIDRLYSPGKIQHTLSEATVWEWRGVNRSS